MKTAHNLIRYIFMATLLLICSTDSMAAGHAISSIKTDQKVVALTFDDGPLNPYTSEILDILKKHDIKATFFVVGENVQSHPTLFKRIIDEGHEIGNHTWSHPMLKFKSAAYIRDQIERTDKAIRDQGYTGTTHFRCPYGLRPKALTGVLEDMGKEHILFNVDPTDWRRPPSETIAKRVLNQTHPGSIVLMHDGGGKRAHTVEALETVISELSAKGYSFVTVEQMLALRNQKKPEENPQVTPAASPVAQASAR
jgi:peptidoglycan/xylan/chitin deacetylase (PgdA/CDA1 family)